MRVVMRRVYQHWLFLWLWSRGTTPFEARCSLQEHDKTFLTQRKEQGAAFSSGFFIFTTLSSGEEGGLPLAYHASISKTLVLPFLFHMSAFVQPSFSLCGQHGHTKTRLHAVLACPLCFSFFRLLKLFPDFLLLSSTCS
ncbi:hypothetical protein IWX92DRAFT_357087 [Phyllosticta citricarpa]